MCHFYKFIVKNEIESENEKEKVVIVTLLKILTNQLMNQKI